MTTQHPEQTAPGTTSRNEVDVTVLLTGGHFVPARADLNLLDYLTVTMAEGLDEVVVFPTTTGNLTIRTSAILGLIR